MTRRLASRGFPFTVIVRGLVAALVLVAELVAGSSKSASTTPKTVHVRQYTRKDGTIVQAHDRAAPGTATRSAVSATPSRSLVTPRTPSSHTAAGTSSKTVAHTTATLGRSSIPASPSRNATGQAPRSSALKATRKSSPCSRAGCSAR
jgi:hypothetical protein